MENQEILNNLAGMQWVDANYWQEMKIKKLEEEILKIKDKYNELIDRINLMS